MFWLRRLVENLGPGAAGTGAPTGVADPAVREPVQRAEQLPALMGLVGVHARLQALLAVPGRERREGDDRQAAGQRSRSRIFAVASNPPMRGMCTSMSTTSKSDRDRASSA